MPTTRAGSDLAPGTTRITIEVTTTNPAARDHIRAALEARLLEGIDLDGDGNAAYATTIVATEDGYDHGRDDIAPGLIYAVELDGDA